MNPLKVFRYLINYCTKMNFNIRNIILIQFFSFTKCKYHDNCEFEYSLVILHIVVHQM